MTRKAILEKALDMASHNLYCCSANLAMTRPKEGYEEQHKTYAEEVKVLEEWIAELTTESIRPAHSSEYMLGVPEPDMYKLAAGYYRIKREVCACGQAEHPLMVPRCQKCGAKLSEKVEPENVEYVFVRDNMHRTERSMREYGNWRGAA